MSLRLRHYDRSQIQQSARQITQPAIVQAIFHRDLALNCLQEMPAVADKPARRLRNVCTVYVRAVGL